VVVTLNPGIDGFLGGLDAGSGSSSIEQLTAQHLVPALDLSGRGGSARFGQTGRDAVIAADPLDEDLDRQMLPSKLGDSRTPPTVHRQVHQTLDPVLHDEPLPRIVTDASE
jgi:hypothetical protein